MSKRFTFTHDSPIRTALLDEHQQPVYKIYTPSKVYGSTTTITRCSGIPPNHREEEMARINWHLLHSSEIVMGGRTLDVSKFIMKTGLTRRDRKFVAHDGQEYKWDLGNFETKLILNNGSGIVVASFNRSSGGLWGKQPRMAHLDIAPQGFHILDLIIVTFVYAEQKNRESDGA
ncbi:hypothetical protein JAAARDRAFT_212117 [Jaapia argillacea MUCL 33604]|uniref:DUF6593 domain-containing protein n=1 Tax=Jaapia argillacea MUCL 33604 TaxID=933084 RepID=A0A067P755_9AGAM|nr:hypothetical protein JAAARDRAFT_212117 [Jaapia argillacea MUCL 33604]